MTNKQFSMNKKQNKAQIYQNYIVGTETIYVMITKIIKKNNNFH